MRATEKQLKRFNCLKEGDVVYPITEDGSFWSLLRGKVSRLKVIKISRLERTVHVEVLEGEHKGEQYALFADELDIERLNYDPTSWMNSWEK